MSLFIGAVMRRYTPQKPAVPGNAREKRGNAFAIFITDALEYVQHCFGINDVQSRYEIHMEKLKEEASEHPPRLSGSDGYEPTSKWER